MESEARNKGIWERTGEFYYSIAKTNLHKLVFFITLAAVFAGIMIILFERDVPPGANGWGFKNFYDGLFWSIVTITSTGYGDRYPITFWGRIVSIVLMFSGSIFLSILSATIASILVERRLKEGRGLIDLRNKQGHFIICGWKSEFSKVLDDILKMNRDFKARDIVLINNKDPQLVEDLKSDPKFRDLLYIHGDFNDENILLRANIRKAKRVLILADDSTDVADEEIDARTVLAVVIIGNLAREVYTCAELLDSKFEKYLRESHCDEIILSRDYSRILLANASSASGIPHIINSLIDSRHDKILATKEIPRHFTSKTFGELSEYYRQTEGSLLIGVLENTGKFSQMRMEALREAQKTADIPKLVENLRMVKRLEANYPVINPGSDYIIKDHSKAIVISGAPGTQEAKDGRP